MQCGMLVLLTNISSRWVEGERRNQIRTILHGAILRFAAMQITWKRLRFKMDLNICLSSRWNRVQLSCVPRLSGGVVIAR